ncbi:hypothetical protein O6H91_21G014800 [Diphasiastrum complanatum]|uniref:Uncharacterized protein n=1 Tax=Diphasiastrum complanatum TaxID=34168 RepID=A0ACC2AI99_DIPCM|nr:hypothetical protein O6H91_21G014800 [Diphasiastrum complanatum]
MSSHSGLSSEEEHVWRYHKHDMQPHQCGSILLKHINAPVHLVWSLVRRFDQPQNYKRFIQSCKVEGDGTVGTIRDVNVISGLPATTSTERLEILDDEQHIFSYKILGGDHRLKESGSMYSDMQSDMAGCQEVGIACFRLCFKAQFMCEFHLIGLLFVKC